MPHGSHGLHHVHKRKRGEIKEALYPHPNKFKQVLDKLVYFAGIAAAIMSIPQVLQIWVEQNAAGVSLITWSTFLVNAIIWTTYGIFHKETPLIVMYVSFIFVDLLIILGILKYG